MKSKGYIKLEIKWENKHRARESNKKCKDYMKYVILYKNTIIKINLKSLSPK